MNRARAKALTLFLLALPARAGTIVVNQTADPLVNDGLCSLREAMFAAGFNIAIDGCPAGAEGLDTVQLAATVYPLRAPIVLGAVDPFLLLGQGRAATSIRPEPDNHGRLFELNAGAVATFQNLQLVNADRWSSTSSLAGGAIRAVDADLTLRNVLLYGNRASFGGGLSFTTSGTARTLRMETCALGFNRADESPAAPGAAGGGLHLDLQAANSSVFILDTEFAENTVSGSAALEIAGGALAADLGAEIHVEVRRSLFLQNHAETGASSRVVGALSAGIAAGAMLRLQDSIFYGNDASEGLAGSTTALRVLTSGALVVERTAFVGEDQGEDKLHVGLEAESSGSILLRSVLIADGPGFGLAVTAAPGAYARLGHLTVTGHANYGLLLANDGTALLDNSILWQNGINLATSGTVAPMLTADLIGIDPHFAAPGIYQLAADSPALDTGNDSASTADLFDLVHGPRRVGTHTDRGAYERRAIFADGFGTGDVSAWPPLPF